MDAFPRAPSGGSGDLADLVLDATTQDVVAEVQRACGGADGVLVTAVSPRAFEQAVGMLGKRGTMALLGLPPGTLPLSIFDTVLNRKTIRGSIVGTRLDLMEALAFAKEGRVQCHFSSEKFEQINAVFDRMRAGAIEGRVVLKV